MGAGRRRGRGEREGGQEGKIEEGRMGAGRRRGRGEQGQRGAGAERSRGRGEQKGGEKRER